MAVHGVIVLAVTAILYPGVFVRGEVTLPGSLIYQYAPWSHHKPDDVKIGENKPTEDILLQFTLWYALTRDAVRDGKWPLWHHYEFMGMPLIGNYQSALFYPIYMLHLFIDLSTAMTVYAILKLWLCGMTAYVCARVMGLRRAGSCFASIAWMCSGLNITWCYWPLPDTGAWVPAVIIAAELLLQGYYRRGTAAMAFSGLLLLLAAHPESSFAGGFGAGLYMMFRIALERRTGPRLYRPLMCASLAWACVLLVTMVQVLPFVDYLTQFHQRVQEGGNRPLLTAQTLASCFVPRFMGSSADGRYWGPHANSNFVTLVYAGIVTWMAASLLLSRGHTRKGLRRIAALAVPSVVLALMAFDAPVVSFLVNDTPFKYMWAIWFIVFPMLALAFLGGFGIDHWFSRPRKMRELLLPLACGVPIAAALVWLYSMEKGVLAMEGNDAYVRHQMLVALGLALATATLIAVALLLKDRVKAAWLLSALLVVDLAVLFSHDMLPTTPRKAVFPRSDLTDYLVKESPPYRVSVLSTPILPGLMPNYRIAQLWGHDGIHPGRSVDYFGLAGRGCWGNAEPLCAVRYYLYPEGTDVPRDGGLRFDRTLDGIDVYLNDNALPPAFLAKSLRVFDTDEAEEQALCAPGFDPRETALTVAPPTTGVLPTDDGSDPGTVEFLERTPDSAEVVVHANRPCVLVLADTYFRGWQARVGDTPAEIFPVYHAFRGVLVPEGDHHVTFTYRPVSFAVGFWISVVSMIAACAVSIRLLVSRAPRPNRGTSP